MTRFFRQAERVHNRLRYFGEEIQTTYKPEKQAALLANVQQTVHPACEEMKRLMESSEELARNDAARDMEALCVRMDKALEQRSLEEFRLLLGQFKPAL